MKERRLSKKKNQQILATLAMGINLVNSMIPLAAALRELPNKSDLQVQQPKSENTGIYCFATHIKLCGKYGFWKSRSCRLFS